MQNRLKPPRSKGQELCWEPRGDHLNLHVWIKQQSYTSSSFDLRWFCLNWFTSNISLRDSKASLSEDTPTRSWVSPAPQVFSFMLPVQAPLGTVRQWNNCTLWDFVCQNEENQFYHPTIYHSRTPLKTAGYSMVVESLKVIFTRKRTQTGSQMEPIL